MKFINNRKDESMETKKGKKSVPSFGRGENTALMAEQEKEIKRLEEERRERDRLEAEAMRREIERLRILNEKASAQREKNAMNQEIEALKQQLAKVSEQKPNPIQINIENRETVKRQSPRKYVQSKRRRSPAKRKRGFLFYVLWGIGILFVLYWL